VAATVLIATHDRGDLLPYAVASALAQTVTAIEVLIVGDGVPAETRMAATELARRDARIRFLDFPKAPNRGEANRHAAVLQARGSIVCHLDDDDLWLPDHVETMLALLHDADLAMTLPVLVQADGTILPFPVDLSLATHRLLFSHLRSTFASSPTFVGYRAEAYRTLPHGWAPPPFGPASDKFVWGQLLAMPGSRVVSSFHATAVGLPSPQRRDFSRKQRVDELRTWAERLTAPGGPARLRQDVLAWLARDHAERMLSVWDEWARKLPPGLDEELATLP
jgi:glycosyltransferase involved in cell wall biosynthesis